jgi:uncharacterized protein
MKKPAAALLALALSIGALVSGSASAEEAASPEKIADTRKLMDVTGALQFGQMLSQTIVMQFSKALKAQRPDLPPEAYTILSEEVGKVVSEEMVRKGGYVDQVIPLYGKYLTHDEIKGLLQFYGTPLGKKLVSVLPPLTRESMMTGQKWAQSLGPKLDARLKARFEQKGIKIDGPAPGQPAPAPAPAK